MNILHLKKEKKVTIEYAITPDLIVEESPSVVDYIKSNYPNQGLSLEYISRALGLSELKVSQQIKQETSQTFKQLRNNIRIENAKILLIKTDVGIAVIAEQVGYENVTSFNRVFKKVMNESPSNFRSLHRKG